MLWSKNEQDRLTEIWCKQTLKQIAIEFGRSCSAVRSAADRYQLRRKQSNPWSADDISALTALWPGYSASVIAAQLGRSRNAVIGKIGRLRQEKVELKRSVQRQHLTQPKPAAARPAIAKATKAPRRRMSRHQTMQCPCQLVELDAINCKWPIGDPREPGFYFCGAVIADGKPYCPAHCRKAHHQREYVHGTRSIAAKPVFFNGASDTTATRPAAGRGH